jgi:solute carrier family 10 (sodium/bile acid cotransporter), member 7
VLIAGFILAIVLLGINVTSTALGFGKQDIVAAMFCGSQKSLVSGVPMASALFSPAAAGPVLVPIMIYYPMQLVVCAWLAKRYSVAPDATLAAQIHPENAADAGMAADGIARVHARVRPAIQLRR